MNELWQGLLFGLLLAFLIGPVFFALIQTSLEKGFKAGLFMAIGISCSDTLYILITYSGFSQISQNIQVKFYLGIFGALIMTVFGINSILKPIPHKGLNRMSGKADNYLRKILKGFILNAINPFLLIFWMGVAGLVTLQMHFHFDQAALFYAGVVSMVLSTDIMKAFLAHRLRDLITPRFMKIMNRAVGIVLIIFGLRLFYFAMELKHVI